MKPAINFIGAALIGVGLAAHAERPADQGASTSSPLRPLAPYSGEPLSAQPYLRERLPQGAMAYLRIPSPWTLLGQPKGSMFSKALASEPYAKTVARLKEGATASLLPEIPDEMRGLVELLVMHAASPLEAVLLPAAEPGGVPAQLLATLKLDLESAAALSKLLERLALGRPDVDLLSPLDSEGYATLQAGPFPVSLGYDAASRRLTLLLSLGPKAGDLRQVTSRLRPVADHKMHAVEADLDASTQGLFLWLDPMPLMQLAQAMGDEGQQAAGLALLGLSEAHSLALSMGTSRGKNRLALRLDMPRIGFRSFLPAVDTNIAFAAAGNPSGLLALALPDTKDLQAVEELLAGMLPPQSLAEYFEGKKALLAEFGVDVDEILAALGEEAILVADDAGIYWAVRIDDWALAEKTANRVLAKLAEKDFRIELDSREIGGVTYHHARVPALAVAESGDASRPEPASRLMDRLEALPNHLYWTEEGDYLVLAQLPQVLLDRAAIAERVPLRAWLRDSQGVHSRGAMLLATLRSRDTPRLLYNLSLESIEVLGDFVERPIDMFALPSALEAGLPESASYSFQLDSTADRLSLEISYDFSPLDILFMGGGYQGLAIMGVLAAIAVPAYEDYVVSAQFAAALEQGTAARQAVTDIYLSTGQFPNAQQVAGLGSDQPSDVVSSIRVLPDSGEVVLELAIPTLPEAATLRWRPRVDASGELRWECSGSFDDIHLPASCRQ